MRSPAEVAKPRLLVRSRSLRRRSPSVIVASVTAGSPFVGEIAVELLRR